MSLTQKSTKFTFPTSIFNTLLISTLLIGILSSCTSAPQFQTTETSLIKSSNRIKAQANNYIPSTDKQGTLLPYTVINSSLKNGLHPTRNLEIRNGGFGSDAAAHPTNPSQFYALTDRGPNAKFKGALGKGKLFPTPNYVPRIGLFELQADGRVKKIKEILLKDTKGHNISGLPNTKNLGGTGERPYDKYGNPILMDMSKPFNKVSNPIKTDIFGLDGEGLAALRDGTFWVSDEYGPHLVHFDANGREINRINAFKADSRNNIIVNGKRILLPAEFVNRRANRGMEGLTITPDQTTLVGIMQSTMDNPSKAVRKQDITRIVTINLVDGRISQYLYKQQSPQNSNSGIVALDNKTFLVIERDGNFQLKKPGAQKHIYKVTLDKATDLEAMTETASLKQDKTLGLTLNGKTLEQIVTADNGSWQTLNKVGIQPVNKTLILDAVKAFNYPHDKLEGIWLMGQGHIGLLNDDDFATWSTKGVLEQKYLDKDQTIQDASRLYIATSIDY